VAWYYEDEDGEQDAVALDRWLPENRGGWIERPLVFGDAEPIKQEAACPWPECPHGKDCVHAVEPIRQEAEPKVWMCGWCKESPAQDHSNICARCAGAEPKQEAAALKVEWPAERDADAATRAIALLRMVLPYLGPEQHEIRDRIRSFLGDEMTAHREPQPLIEHTAECPCFSCRDERAGSGAYVKATWKDEVLELIDQCPGLTLEQDQWLSSRVRALGNSRKVLPRWPYPGDEPATPPAWGVFLAARLRLMQEWSAEGRSNEQIAAELSMDSDQARLILAAYKGAA
jgi:hypothetical protein